MVSRDNIYPLEGARTNASFGVKVNTTIRKLSESTYEIRRDWGRVSSGQYDGVVYEVGKEYVFDYTPEYTQIGDLRIDRVPDTTGLCTTTYYIGYQNDTFDLWGNRYYPPGVRATKRIFSVYTTGEIIGESLATYTKDNSLFDFYDKTSQKYLENKGTEPWTGAYEAWVYDMGRPLSGLVFSGAQYIDTKYIVKSNTKIKSSFIVNDDSRSRYIYGADNGSSNNSNFGIFSDAIKVIGVTNRQTASTNYVDVPLILNNKYVVEHSHQNVIIDGESRNYPIDGQIALPSSSLFIGAIHRGATTVLFLEGEVNAYEVLEDDLTVQKLIPFITWEGVKGYLNLVNRELLLNQGTGEFQVPTIPVYAINWQEETFDPIAGKTASIGTSGNTTGLGIKDWTDAQKQTFRGKKLKISFKISAKDVVLGSSTLLGNSPWIRYKDGTITAITAATTTGMMFSGLTSPYTLPEDYSFAVVAQIEDREIDTLERASNFALPQVQSGELKAHDIKWEVDVPEDEIYAIETLNASGIAAQADYQNNIDILNQIGIK